MGPSTKKLRAQRAAAFMRYRRKCPEKHRAYVRKSRLRAIQRDPDYDRRLDLQKKYGVTVEWYDAALVAQEFACAICKKPEADNDKRLGKPMRLSVDHCHDTNKVRGLLCNTCNRAIGLLKHDIGAMHSAVAYLLKASIT